jgi:hypothetical protein
MIAINLIFPHPQLPTTPSRLEGFPQFLLWRNPMPRHPFEVAQPCPTQSIGESPIVTRPHDPLPLDWLLRPTKDGSLLDRVLGRLIQSEAHEANPHFRDDYRQTFIALSLARDGNPIPFVEASYRMYGLHPDKVYPAIMARRQALLGRDGVLSMAPAKAVPSPVTSPKCKEGAA